MVERGALKDGTIIPLIDFGSVTFRDAFAKTADGNTLDADKGVAEDLVEPVVGRPAKITATVAITGPQIITVTRV
jgi:hypothetical protein